MPRSWRATFTLILVCVALGCTREDVDQVQLEFWAIGSEGEVLRKLLDDFHQQQPGIRVVVQQIPWNAAHEKLLTAFAGQATPDMCQLGNTWIPEFAMLQSLEELSERTARSRVIDREDYFEGIWATNEIEGRLYGIPWYVDTRVLFYRQDLLREAGWETPPRTWEEWHAAMLAIQRQLPPGRHAILLPTNEWEQLVILGLQMADSFLREDNRYGNFRGAGFRRAFEFYLRLYRDGLAPVLASTEIANMRQELARGTYAMYITGPWNMGEFLRKLPSEEQPRWATAPLPAPDNGGPGASMAGGCSLVIFRQSRHPDEAWRFLEYLSAPETQIRFYELSGNLPARVSSWDRSELREDRWAQAFRGQLQRVTPTPQIPEWERIATRIYEVADQVIRRALTVDEGLRQLDLDVDRILEKRRWLRDRKSAQQPARERQE